MSTAEYLCWLPEDGGTREDAVGVDAYSEQSAAEKFAERDWSRGGYERGTEATLRVAVAHKDETTHWDIEVEMLPEFTARKAAVCAWPAGCASLATSSGVFSTHGPSRYEFRLRPACEGHENKGLIAEGPVEARFAEELA